MKKQEIDAYLANLKRYSLTFSRVGAVCILNNIKYDYVHYTFLYKKFDKELMRINIDSTNNRYGDL